MSSGAQPRPQPPDRPREAGLALLQVYSELAERGSHLLGDLLQGQPPKQWAHYPEDDARDPGGYQWFYHSHDPEDRPGAVEHGHIHLFARRPLWGPRLRSRSELAFAQQCGQPTEKPPTRHLLTIGFDAKGLPVSLFTVNSWVTGDLMLGSALTLDLLHRMTLDTGYGDIDTVITSVVHLYRHELHDLLVDRDRTLLMQPGGDPLHDKQRELLSELRIDLDAKLACVLEPGLAGT